MLPDREKLSVAAQTRADRTFPREVVAVEALTAGAAEGKQPLLSWEAVAGNRVFPKGVVVVEALTGAAVVDNRASPSGVGVKVLLEDHRGAAVKRGNKAAVVLQAVKAHPQEGAVAAAAVAVAEGVAPVAAVVVAVAGRKGEAARMTAPTFLAEKDFVTDKIMAIRSLDIEKLRRLK